MMMSDNELIKDQGHLRSVSVSTYLAELFLFTADPLRSIFRPSLCDEPAMQ